MAIELNPAHKGLLHKRMGIPAKKKISVADLMAEKSKAKRSGDTKLEKEANFALVAKTKWNK